ncbi:hypothetical protein FNYG_02350 [Fusarium nygamai]|uniref:Uncharacterized protein n=1 Tax=Gibberella nygamai TaxID=42673 RepID=A0A2K0WPX4_GIBNY|nr:hypothetical protein FNYG_02350 [Fusarium nygamai]
MASFDHIATVFSYYKYDEKVGFDGVIGIPCLGCVSDIDRDARCVCRSDSPHRSSPSCLLCKENKKTCGSIPSELLGAAQWYWNFVVNLSRRDPKGQRLPKLYPTLTGSQLWRYRRVLDNCGSSWRELEMHLMNPNNMEILAVQESTANREMLTLSLLQTAGIIRDNNELQGRITAAQPPYARATGCVRTLRAKLAILSGSLEWAVPPGKEHEFDSLSYNLSENIAGLMLRYHVPAPHCAVVHSGGMPVYLDQK